MMGKACNPCRNHQKVCSEVVLSTAGAVAGGQERVRRVIAVSDSEEDDSGESEGSGPKEVGDIKRWLSKTESPLVSISERLWMERKEKMKGRRRREERKKAKRERPHSPNHLLLHSLFHGSSCILLDSVLSNPIVNKHPMGRS
jgi:hypothetical protein